MSSDPPLCRHSPAVRPARAARKRASGCFFGARSADSIAIPRF